MNQPAFVFCPGCGVIVRAEPPYQDIGCPTCQYVIVFKANQKLKLMCPCGKHISVLIANSGKAGRCPRCRNGIFIPKFIATGRKVTPAISKIPKRIVDPSTQKVVIVPQNASPQTAPPQAATPQTTTPPPQKTIPFPQVTAPPQKIVTFYCPYCSVKATVPEAVKPFGKKARCKKCSKVFELTQENMRQIVAETSDEIKTSQASLPEPIIASLSDFGQEELLSNLGNFVVGEDVKPSAISHLSDFSTESIDLPDKQEAEVRFVRKYTQEVEAGKISIYEVYKTETVEGAKKFLLQQKISEELHYKIVETPQGNWGRDINGLFQENPT